MRVAIVHDWLNQIGGAEAVLEALVASFAGAPVYTSMYSPAAMPAAYRSWDIRTTWMDHLPGIHRHHQPYLPLYPLAFGGLTLSDYDLVISNKSAFCLGIHTSPGTPHLCYCLSPTRFVWDLTTYVERESVGAAVRLLTRLLVPSLKRWERAAATHVTAFAAISREIQARIRRYYNRDSILIYPPVDTRSFSPAADPEDYFLIASRLIPYKRIDLAVQAFSELGLPLWIAGSGRDQARLEAMAGPSVRFLGRVPDQALPNLYARCRAYILPGLEDFAISPVEAMAAGRPVIAYGQGGALDTVVDGVTGTFFFEPSAASLAAAVERFQALSFDPPAIGAHARQFDTAVFREKLAAFVAHYTSLVSSQPEV
jgi:glycosyltransferase involved in cell wall biosynthesis